jgi:putative transcriptional regulator
VNPMHHPVEAVMAAYAAGTLADGPGLVVAAHIERCPHCRSELKLYEEVGGALLSETEPVAMQTDALALALARIERPAPATPRAQPIRVGPEDLVLPAALARRRIGARRYVGPGIWVAPVLSRKADGWRTYLLRAPSGVQVPHHGHNGDEFTVVLRGTVVDETGRYGVGDFCGVDESLEHHPEAEGPTPCICLISGEGGVRPTGILRLLKPLIGV